MSDANPDLAAHYAFIRDANTGSPLRREGTELLIRTTGWARAHFMWLDADGYIDASRMSDECISGYSGERSDF